jgi:hypothetical protein
VKAPQSFQTSRATHWRITASHQKSRVLSRTSQKNRILSRTSLRSSSHACVFLFWLAKEDYSHCGSLSSVEDWGSMFLWNVGAYTQYYMVMWSGRFCLPFGEQKMLWTIYSFETSLIFQLALCLHLQHCSFLLLQHIIIFGALAVYNNKYNALLGLWRTWKNLKL